MTTWNPDGTDSKESTADDFSLIRRDVLAGAGLIGLAGLGSGLVAAEDGD